MAIELKLSTSAHYATIGSASIVAATFIQNLVFAQTTVNPPFVWFMYAGIGFLFAAGVAGSFRLLVLLDLLLNFAKKTMVKAETVLYVISYILSALAGICLFLASLRTLILYFQFY